MRVVVENGAFPPERAHPEDAGLDLRMPRREYYEAHPETRADNPRLDVITVGPHGRRKIDTGVHVEIPAGCAGFLKSKSGLMANRGVTTDGTIDEGYTGTIQVVVFNHSDEPVVFVPGDKITQLVIQRVEKPDLEFVSYLDETPRGNGGFGSTGK